jgi:hypothetical protein
VRCLIVVSGLPLKASHLRNIEIAVKDVSRVKNWQTCDHRPGFDVSLAQVQEGEPFPLPPRTGRVTVESADVRDARVSLAGPQKNVQQGEALPGRIWPIKAW